MSRPLPRQVERQVEVLLDETAVNLRDSFQPFLADRGTLLQKLNSLAGDLPAEAPRGPVRLASPAADWVQAMAALYTSAFKTDGQVFPYFEQP